MVCERVTVGEKKRVERRRCSGVGKSAREKERPRMLTWGGSGEWEKERTAAERMNKNQRDKRIRSPPGRPARRCYDCLAMGRRDWEKRKSKKKRERECESEVKGRTRRWLLLVEARLCHAKYPVPTWRERRYYDGQWDGYAPDRCAAPLLPASRATATPAHFLPRRLAGSNT